MAILQLIRPELLNSHYEIPEDTLSACRLHANELPWSPLQTQDLDLHIYPEYAMQKELRTILAARYQIDENQLLLTRGSDDGIDLITRLFLTAGRDAFLQCSPTFPMYAFYVHLQQAQLLECPLDLNNLTLSQEQINDFWQPNCKIIMLCNPNNPTAHLVSLDLIAALCERYTDRSLIVVDEAYIEFSKSESAISLMSQYDNLVVLRTLSKAYGMAGLRLGSIIAQPQVINAFKKIIAPYVLSNVVIQLAKKALTGPFSFDSAIEKIQESRAWLLNQLSQSTVIEKTYPTETNFILVKTAYAKELASWLASNHIAVRTFTGHPLLYDHVRITVGDEQHNRLFIDSLKSFNPLELGGALAQPDFI
jgi:histidinol-phosphate aminotransferase